MIYFGTDTANIKWLLKFTLQNFKIIRKLRVATEIGSTFLFSTSCRAADNTEKLLCFISMKFSIDRIPSCLILEFWDFGQIMAKGHWVKSQNRDSRVFSSSPWNFWSIEHNHALYCKFGTLAGLWSRPPAHMTMSLMHKTFLLLRPFKGALTCSILIAGTQVILRKAYFLRRGSWLRPESWTPRPRIPTGIRTVILTCPHQRTYVQIFSSLGAIPAEK
jgi:hypothetical protein